mgnify:CR=1 FL=1
MVAQVVLGARDPEYAPFAQMEKIGKMHVSFVENRDLSGQKPGESSCRCPSTFQNNACIMSLLRCLLACERLFRLGATAPRIARSLDA